MEGRERERHRRKRVTVMDGRTDRWTDGQADGGVVAVPVSGVPGAFLARCCCWSLLESLRGRERGGLSRDVLCVACSSFPLFKTLVPASHSFTRQVCVCVCVCVWVGGCVPARWCERD